MTGKPPTPPSSDTVRRTVPPLDETDRATYEWQLWTPGFDEASQSRLKSATVLISRVGGLGSPAAYELAAAGVGRLILCHAGDVKTSDLNRQLLMTHDWLGRPRVESAARRLRELNPRLDIVAVPENISESNAESLIAQADLVIDAAPLFEERLAMNDAAVRQGTPVIECAMYEMQATLTTVIPGRTPCLRCLVPEPPEPWKRKFPVFGAVSGTVGCLGAMEAIKLLTGLGEPLAGRMLTMDLRTMRFRVIDLGDPPPCPLCAAKVSG